MALWPFSKKNKDDKANAASDKLSDKLTVADATTGNNEATEAVGAAATAEAGSLADAAPAETAAAAPAAAVADVEVRTIAHDPINGETGPFDGDAVNIEDFNFSDFSVGILDLGSMRIPLPKDSQVQVEMGPQGPRMLHIVTRHGRMTPVAFAAPRSSGQWKESAKELMEGVARDGFPTILEDGPWGSEVVGRNANGSVRIIGVEGPRWLARMTLTAPAGMEEDLTALARETLARTFVYRGDAPILAGQSLPITLPPQLVEQVQQAMVERQKQAQAAYSASESTARIMDEVHGAGSGNSASDNTASDNSAGEAK